MRHVLLLAAAVVPFVIATAEEASSQHRGVGYHAGGGAWGGRAGWHGGGAWRGGGWHGGGGAWRGAGWRGGAWHGSAWRGAAWRGGGWYGGGWNRPYVRAGWGWRRGWGYPGYDRGWNSGWGWGVAGLAAGTAIGAAIASPYYYDPYVYRRGVYVTPAYGGIGGFCATPVRTCQLINLSVIGGGCSCRVAGGRARGVVVGP